MTKQRLFYVGWLLSSVEKQETSQPGSLRSSKMTGNPAWNNFLPVSKKSSVSLKQSLYSRCRDESQPREILLHVLTSISTEARFDRIQLLVTSRSYIDIKTAMSKISQPLLMSDPRVAADIGHYVAQKARASPKFREWPPWLCDEVQSALAVGAKGMFRWAVCQLDILRRINDIGSIRAALRDLLSYQYSQS